MNCLPNVNSGDFVELQSGVAGWVKFCSWTSSYSEAFQPEDWPGVEYDGLMIEQENGALLFTEKDDFLTGSDQIVHPRDPRN